MFRRGGLAGVVLAMATMAASAQAATFTVTRADDPAPGGCAPSDCSLREAIKAANNRNGPDDVILASGRKHVLERSPSALSVEDPVTVKAAGGGRAVIDAGRNGGAFKAFGQDEPQLKLVGLIVQGATDSDAAISGDVISLLRTTVRGNKGSGVSAGFITMKRSTVSGNGGRGVGADRGAEISLSKISRNEGGGVGLFNEENSASRTIDRSLITQNSSPFFGAGLLNASAVVTVTRSTISHNTTEAGGGGIANYSQDNEPAAVLTLVNSTVAENEAKGFSGGIDSFRQSADFADLARTTIRSSTVADNIADSDNFGGELGGGVHNGGAILSTSNTIIAGNALGSGNTHGADCNGNIGSTGDNLIGDPAGCASSLGDVFGAPGLKPLDRNGGPTPTMALTAGSAAINAAWSPTCPKVDQRGVKRDNCDIGAFERR
jgi:CSLREA domain-containing protein